MIFFRRSKGYSDIQVVRAYQTGDKKVQQYWYDACLRQFGKGTFRYGSLTDYDREDLFQNSFILLWEKMESRQIHVVDDTIWVATRQGEREVTELMAYFMRIVKNKYLELLRSGKFIVEINPEITSSGDDIGDEFADDPFWDEDPEVEKDRIVSQCLLSLPKSCLEILTMFYYQKKSLEEILAERPENTSYAGLKSRKSKCMANLKKRINESFAKAGLK
ncbi:MAG: sigma-70 family RNA polymerase sigma factor [Muribaculaceae bacterium]|nr:sigma-70 family RNA polymerase sigma factor [Muribaculaceae bacterium]